MITKEGSIGKACIDRAFAPLLIILVGVSAYGLGRLNNIRSNAEPVTINAPSEVGPAVAGSTSTNTKEGKVVASKNGSKYHLSTCPGAGQIKEENKIWFESAAAAVAAGYTSAANCPGLK